MLSRRQVLLGASALASTAVAQQPPYPTSTIKLIYNFAPGGPGDAVARYLAERMGSLLGQQVVVENRTGASGAIGILAAARSAGDGYTMLFTSLPGIVQLPYLSADKSFDPARSLQPIGQVGVSPLVILARSSVPPHDYPSFAQWARAQRDPVAVAGAGPIIDLAAARLSREGQLKLEVIPYRGAAPALQAVLAGDLNFYFVTPSAMTAEYVKAGKLKVVGVTTAEPSALVPGGVPISKFVPGYVQDISFDLWVPPGVPSPITTRLSQVLKQVMAQPGTTERLLEFGIEARSGGSADVSRALTREVDNIRKILAADPNFKFGQ